MTETTMKLEEIRVESFATSGDEAAMMPTATWMDATAGCCAPPPPFSDDYTCTCQKTCV